MVKQIWVLTTIYILVKQVWVHVLTTIYVLVKQMWILTTIDVLVLHGQADMGTYHNRSTGQAGVGTYHDRCTAWSSKYGHLPQ